MNFVRYFKKIGDVDLVYQRTGFENLVEDGTFRNVYKIGMITGEAACRNVFLDRFRMLKDRRPSVVSEWTKEAIRELHGIIAGGNYDFILCRYMHDSSPFIDFPSDLKKKVIIDMDDVFSSSLFDFYVKRKPGFYGGLKWRLQKKLLFDFQERCLAAGAAIFCSEEDMKEIGGHGESCNAHLVPNTYPSSTRIKEPDGSGYANRRTLLFVGALDYGPNINGLKWFVESIFPGVAERYPEARLLVVGRKPTEGILRLCAEHPGVELHQNVPDVSEYYDRCGAVVVPLLAGGGTRIKILEAAMAARPVLSTPLGAYGFGSDDGTRLLHFTDSGSFLERYGFLEDERNYRDCVIDTHEAVQRMYSPAAFDRSMAAVVESLL